MNINQFFKGKTSVGTNHTYGLTSLGKTKAEDLSLHGNKGTVVACMNENGASSISEISEETKINADHVKNILRVLIRNGYVHKVSSED